MQAPPPSRQDQQDTQNGLPSARTLDEPSTAQAVAATYALIGRVLLGGVIVSASVIVLGLLLELLQPNTFASHKLQLFPQTFEQFWAGLLVLRPQAVITLGLLLLIATPVVRVEVSVVAFVVERDRKFVVITLVVLFMLLFSIFYIGAVVVVSQHQHFQHGNYSWIYPVLIFSARLPRACLARLLGLVVGY